MIVEDVSSGVVVIGVVHAPTDGGIVIAQYRHRCEFAYFIATFVGLWAVSDDVAKAQILIARMFAIKIEHDV